MQGSNASQSFPVQYNIVKCISDSSHDFQWLAKSAHFSILHSLVLSGHSKIERILCTKPTYIGILNVLLTMSKIFVFKTNHRQYFYHFGQPMTLEVIKVWCTTACLTMYQAYPGIPNISVGISIAHKSNALQFLSFH